jgi:hypothetical protein
LNNKEKDWELFKRYLFKPGPHSWNQQDVLFKKTYGKSKRLLEHPLIRTIHNLVQNKKDLDEELHPEVRKHLIKQSKKEMKDIQLFLKKCLENLEYDSFKAAAEIFEKANSMPEVWSDNVSFSYEVRLDEAIAEYRRKNKSTMDFSIDDLFGHVSNEAERKGFRRAARSLGFSLRKDPPGPKV